MRTLCIPDAHGPDHAGQTRSFTHSHHAEAHQMNTRRIPVAALIAGALLLGSMQGVAQDKAKADKPQASPDEQEMMKKWQAVSTPGEGHKKLEDVAGTWDVELKRWSQGPDKPPAVTRGSA